MNNLLLCVTHLNKGEKICMNIGNKAAT